MDDCQELIGFIAGQDKQENNNLSYQGQSIQLDPPWPRMSVDEAFRYAMQTWSAEEALAKDCFEEVMVNEIEPHLGLNPAAFSL